ncbi:MAG: cytidylate kinase-like family protein [Acidobacteriota bacterium]
MAIVTISRGSYSRGKDVAEKVAGKLGYDCISRDILLDASELFNIPEVKLVRAIHDAPSILDRFTYGRESYVAYIQAALLRYLKEDNIVYHGLAGHFFVPGVAHVLKVRIIADLEDRIRTEMEREKTDYIEARRTIEKDDEQRRKWSLSLYGIDTNDSSLYDLVVHIRHLTVDDAAELICDTVKLDRFRTTPQSLKAISDLSLAADVKAALMTLNPHLEVSADDGNVVVRVKALPQQMDAGGEIESTAAAVRGVKTVSVKVAPMSLYTR